MQTRASRGRLVSLCLGSLRVIRVEIQCGFYCFRVFDCVERNGERLRSLESSTEDCRGGARSVGHRLLLRRPDPLLLYFYDESDFAIRTPGFVVM